MESSSNKCGVSDSKRNRSLDLKSLYESRVSRVTGAKKDGSNVSEHGNVKKRKRKNRKEFPLSFFQSDTKRTKEEGVNGVKLEQKSSGKSQGFSNISLAFSENGAPFVIPRRPRGSIERKKLETDQVHEPPIVTSSVNHVGESNTANGVSDTQEEAILGDNPVRSGTPSATNGHVSSTKATRSSCDFNSKSKLRNDSKLSVNMISSNAKVKNKEKADEVTGSASDHSASRVHDAQKENSHLTLKPRTDPKITVKSRRSKSNSRSKIDGGDPKEKSNDQSSSAKTVAKAYTETSMKKKVGKSSDVKSIDSNLKTRVEEAAHEVKDQVDVQPTSAPHECSKAVKDVDKNSKKPQRKGRKKRDLTVGDAGETSKKKSEPSIVSSVSNNHYTDYQDDDEDDGENLEKNAARMLSSRFDPSCTGYSSRRRYSAFQKPDTGSSTRVSFRSHAKSLTDRDSSSADDKSRALRPRREDKVRGTRRKRRHFYEILPDDLDPYWVLNQRIKIFWPLDESWYYGLVDEYHSETKLHHIKYDDRDEEWVNLPEEKFKILLLPGDAPGGPKSRKRVAGDRYSQKKQETKQEEGNLLTENCCDSEPIASWLANQPQLPRSSSKTLKSQRASQERQSLALSMSSGETGDSDADSFGPKLKTISDVTGKLRNFCPQNSSLSNKNLLSGKNVVYVRRKYRESGFKSSSVFENAKACMDGLVTTKGREHIGWMNSNMPLWCFDDCGILKLNDVLMKSNDIRFLIHLPWFRFMEFACELGASWIVYHKFMLQNGVIVATSPAILLEMVFVDNNLGLKLLLFEGCLRQAVALVSIILILFNQSTEFMDENMGLPVTSIRFRIFSDYDLNKQHVFAFYSFSGLERAKWLYLESKILQHCLFIKGLSVLDCTHDNIKKLEYASSQHYKPHAEVVLSSNEYRGPRRKVMPGILPILNSLEAHTKRMMQSTIPLSAKDGKSPQFALSFSAAPSFFESLHMELLKENSFACINLHHRNPDSHVGEPVAKCANLCGLQDCVTEAPDSNGLPSYLKDQPVDVGSSGNVSVCHDRLSGCSADLREHTKKMIDESKDCEAWDASVPPNRNAAIAVTSMPSNLRMESLSSHLTGSSSVEKDDVPFQGEVSISGQTSDGDWNLHENFVVSSSAGFRKSWKRGRTSFLSSPREYRSPTCPDGVPNFMPRAFSNGPKKPRTQVQYSLPYVGYDFSSKQKSSNSAALPYKRIRRASLKISDGNGQNQKIYDGLTCIANILVTQGDKGWREYGANIVLELADHNEWRLSIKQSGVPRYHYKVKHILQPGSTNRYSHAMMWKGGKDWMLEFTGRSQWMHFKEMHEECFNRNIRAASVKNIPIPGVRLVEDCDDQGTDASFTRNSERYIRQVQNDVEMAMDPSRILYDLDSDDERWLVANSNLDVRHECEGLSEEFLEKAMDTFEKFSYAQFREEFSNSEVEELVMGLGSVEAGKFVYEYWRKKREKMGMPLVRHLQPPLWERHQKKLKEWSHTVARLNTTSSDGSHERRIPSEKPPMFAFCLKPRGLEVPNKFSKQRSHRKIAVRNHASSGTQDSLHGRIANGHVFIDEKPLHASSIHYSADVSPSLLASTQDAHFLSSTDAMEWKGAGPPELSLSRNFFFGGTYTRTTKPQNNPDIHEFHVRDASATAIHARNLAKLKRDRAHRLFFKADVAIHRAVIALMAAEAIKDSAEKSGGSN